MPAARRVVVVVVVVVAARCEMRGFDATLCFACCSCHCLVCVLFLSWFGLRVVLVIVCFALCAVWLPSSTNDDHDEKTPRDIKASATAVSAIAGNAATAAEADSLFLQLLRVLLFSVVAAGVDFVNVVFGDVALAVGIRCCCCC